MNSRELFQETSLNLSHEHTLLVNPQCEVINQIEIYPDLKQAIISDLVKNNPKHNTFQFLNFAGLTMSGKSTIVAQIYADISTHPDVSEWEKINKRKFKKYHLSMATANAIVQKTGIIQKPRELYGPKEHKTVSEIISTLSSLGQQYLDGPALFFQEGIMVTGFPMFNGSLTFKGDQRGGVGGVRNQLSNNPNSKLIVVSASEEQRDFSNKDREAVRNTPPELLPKTMASRGILDDRVFKFQDPTVFQEVIHQYKSLVGNQATRKDADMSLTKTIWQLIKHQDKNTNRYLLPEPQFFPARSVTLEQFRQHYLVDFKKEWTDYLNQFFYPRWLHAMTGDNSNQGYLLINSTLPPGTKRHEFKIWQNEADVFTNLIKVAQRKDHKLLKSILVGEFGAQI